MFKTAPVKTLATLALTAVFTVQVASCGWILYPERRNNAGKGGEIDPAVAVMDGLLLLLVIVPGVVAFAVDVATGAIYLSGGKRAALDVNTGNDAGKKQAAIDLDKLEQVLKEANGIDVDLHARDVVMMHTGNVDQAMAFIAAYEGVNAVARGAEYPLGLAAR